MSIILKPTLVPLNGEYVEVYERDSRVDAATKQKFGLSTTEPLKTSIGVAQVPEYILLTTSNIPAGSSKTFDLQMVEQAIEIESVFIDSPSADQFTFEIYDGANKILSFILPRNMTPYEFPTVVLPPNVNIKILADKQIDYVRIYAKPAVLIAAVTAVEDIGVIEDTLY
jgi:hypothetical protein